MRWLDIINDSIAMNLSKLQERVEDRGVWRAAVPGAARSWTRLSAQQSIQRPASDVRFQVFQRH